MEKIELETLWTQWTQIGITNYCELTNLAHPIYNNYQSVYFTLFLACIALASPSKKETNCVYLVGAGLHVEGAGHWSPSSWGASWGVGGVEGIAEGSYKSSREYNYVWCLVFAAIDHSPFVHLQHAHSYVSLLLKVYLHFQH